MVTAQQRKIPITILTGFLGSGKTTLLNSILTGNHGKKIAVIENEFGAEGIDKEILKVSSTEEIIEVSNGCMCCLIRKDWMEAIETLLHSGKEIDAIIIEASGASEPLPIAQSFLMNDMGGRVKIDSIVCLIDGLNYETLFADDAKIAIEQLEFADFIVMNKCDLISTDKREFLKSAIRKVNAFAPLIETSHGHIDMDLIFESDRFHISEAIEQELKRPHTHRHTDLDTWQYTCRGKFRLLDLDAFFKDLDTDCYRVKGFVQFVEKGDIWYIVQKAGARISIEDWKGESPKKGRILFIGRGLQTHILHTLLDEASEAPKSVLFS